MTSPVFSLPAPSIPIHPLLGAVFAALEEAGIRWCLLRFPANPMAPTGDVDLLIDRAHLPAARRILRSLTFAAGSGTEFMFFSYHAKSDHWLCLHVVTQLGFGTRYELRTRAAAGCLERRQWIGNLAYLAPADEFWITLLHCLLDHQSVAQRHRANLQKLLAVECDESPLAAVVLKACPPSWNPERMKECVAQGDWATLTKFAPELAVCWRHRSPLGSTMWNLVSRILQLPVRLVQALRLRGLSMAVLGPDGAGKSTLVEGIARSFCRPVRGIYMGFGGQGVPPLLTRLRVPGIGAPGHLLVLWWQSVKAQYLRCLGYLVIFDRYSYDTLASPPKQYQNWVSRFGSWVKARAFPAPQLIVLLDAPGSLMFERKGEMTAEVLEAQRQRYLALRERFHQARVVDATQPQDAVRIEVLTLLWELYRTHWR